MLPITQNKMRNVDGVIKREGEQLFNECKMIGDTFDYNGSDAKSTIEETKN